MLKLALINVFLLAIVFKQLAWISFTPIWQTPDEQAHFAQASVLSETNSFIIPEKNLSKEIYESERELGVLRDSFGNNKYTYHPEFNISFSESTIGPSETKLALLPKKSRTEFILNEAAWYPPMYYLASAPFYKTFTEGSLFDRVFAVRILNIIFMVALGLVTLKIGELVFNKNNLKAIYLSILVCFAPMVTFVYTGVTSDTLFILLFTLFLWRCLLLIKNGITVKNLLLILLIVVTSLYTKPQANIMAFILAPLFVYLLIFKNKNKKILLVSIAVIILSLFGIIFRVARGASVIPETNGVFNLSVSAVAEHLNFTFTHTYREVLPWFWGVFRWLSLGIPEILRKTTNWLTIISFIGFAFCLIRQFMRVKLTDEFLMKVFLAFSLIVYFGALTIFDFGFRQTHGYSFGIQGRYFFPVIVPIMTIFLIGLTEIFPEKFQLTAGGILSILMVLFNIFIFFWVAGSYYDLFFPSFLIQASQYKPIWLKFPINLFILFGFIISSLFLSATVLKKMYATKSD